MAFVASEEGLFPTHCASQSLEEQQGKGLPGFADRQQVIKITARNWALWRITMSKPTLRSDFQVSLSYRMRPCVKKLPLPLPKFQGSLCNNGQKDYKSKSLLQDCVS